MTEKEYWAGRAKLEMREGIIAMFLLVAVVNCVTILLLEYDGHTYAAPVGLHAYVFAACTLGCALIGSLLLWARGYNLRYEIKLYEKYVREDEGADETPVPMTVVDSSEKRHPPSGAQRTDPALRQETGAVVKPPYVRLARPRMLGEDLTKPSADLEPQPQLEQ